MPFASSRPPSASRAFPPCARSRRDFLKSLPAGAMFAAGVASTLRPALAAEDGDEVRDRGVAVAPPPPSFSPSVRSAAKVAVVRCRGFGQEIHAALAKSFDLLGGVESLVRGKTVTIKLNLTGTDFAKVFDRPVGESYMTHPDSALALTALLFKAGAHRVRFVESNQRIEPLERTVVDAGWDVKAFEALGRVEWENTRNLGRYKQYAQLKVPSGGYLFSSFQLNRAYEETDVFVSLSKLKNHLTCGVTMSLKNLFGLTPNSLYGDQAPNENATAGRGPLHNRQEYKGSGLMPGELKTTLADSAFLRVPRIVADLNEARPVHLSIVDGVVTMKGGEGPWAPDVKSIAPGVLIVGLNPVSTDAVATAIMGYADPRAARGMAPFGFCDNHLLLAEQRGVGVLELARIDQRGLALRDAICPFG